MNNFYYVVTIQENEKYYSYVLPVKQNNNLLSAFKIKNVINITPHKTKKHASSVANFLNIQYKTNENYLFQYPVF